MNKFFNFILKTQILSDNSHQNIQFPRFLSTMQHGMQSLFIFEKPQNKNI